MAAADAEWDADAEMLDMPVDAEWIDMSIEAESYIRTPVSYFGLDRIKIDDTVVSEIPSIQFNFNTQYVMEWIAEIEE